MCADPQGELELPDLAQQGDTHNAVISATGHDMTHTMPVAVSKAMALQGVHKSSQRLLQHRQIGRLSPASLQTCSARHSRTGIC